MSQSDGFCPSPSLGEKSKQKHATGPPLQTTLQLGPDRELKGCWRCSIASPFLSWLGLTCVWASCNTFSLLWDPGKMANVHSLPWAHISTETQQAATASHDCLISYGWTPQSQCLEWSDTVYRCNTHYTFIDCATRGYCPRRVDSVMGNFFICSMLSSGINASEWGKCYIYA